MYDPLQTGVVALALALAVLVLVLLVLDRRPPTWALAGVGVVELLLLAQLVVGIVQLAAGEQQVSGLTFVGYLVGSLVVLPLAVLWSLGEPGRGGTGVLLVGLLVVPVLVLRLQQIWAAGA